MRALFGFIAVLALTPSFAFADTRSQNVDDFDHQAYVLRFLSAVARRDSDVFARMVAPEARLSGYDRRTSKDRDEPLTLDNAQEMIESCRFLNIGLSFQSDIKTKKRVYQTVILWDCGKLLGKQAMYISYEKGRIKNLNPFGPPPVSIVF